MHVPLAAWLLVTGYMQRNMATQAFLSYLLTILMIIGSGDECLCFFILIMILLWLKWSTYVLVLSFSPFPPPSSLSPCGPCPGLITLHIQLNRCPEHPASQSLRLLSPTPNETAVQWIIPAAQECWISLSPSPLPFRPLAIPMPCLFSPKLPFFLILSLIPCNSQTQELPSSR